MSALALDSEFRSDRQISADFLAYLQSESPDRVSYEVEPSRLTGGNDARLYRYKLIDQEPRVLRVLRSARQAEELMYLQLVHQILNQQGLKAPVIHRICGDKSILGGVSAVMELVPGQNMFGLASELHAKVLGESMANMHGLDVKPIVDSFRRAGIPDERFLSPAIHRKALDFFEKKVPWASDLILWLWDHLPLGDGSLAVVHGDYHGGNLMFNNGSISGVLDWSFCVSDPAVDLAHAMNAYLIFAPQSELEVSSHLWEQIMDEALQAYQAIRPLNHEHIKACRVFHLFCALTAGLSGGGIEFMRKPESQCEYLAFIERTTGLTLSPSA